MPVLWHQDRLSNLDKAQIFVVLLPFFKRPCSRLFNAAQDLELTVQEIALEGVFVFGGWNCRGRVKVLVFCLERLVRACRIALRGQKHPPGRFKGC